MDELAKILLNLESEGAVEVANNYITFQYVKFFGVMGFVTTCLIAVIYIFLIKIIPKMKGEGSLNEL